MPISLIAPIGGQPQVVTFALDYLLRIGEMADEVYVMHLAASEPRIGRSLLRLYDEFVNNRYGGRPCRLRRVPLLRGDLPLADIRNAQDAEIAWLTARTLISELKQQGHQLHICVAGGRRVMGLMLAAAATLLCDHHDRLWHLYTPDNLRAAAAGGAVMHAGPESGVQLIPVPMAPWGAYFPALRAMAQAPQEAVAAQMGWLRSDDERRCDQVMQALTPRQQDALCAFARGLRPQEVADCLQVTLSTVNAHKTAILAECRNVWEIDSDLRLDFHFIESHFGPYFQTRNQL